MKSFRIGRLRPAGAPDRLFAPCPSSIRVNEQIPVHQIDWDAGDLGCGDLVLQLHFLFAGMQVGDVIRVRATDAGAVHDLPAWCRMTGNAMAHSQPEDHLFWIRRGTR